jgi:hypothetical protein
MNKIYVFIVVVPVIAFLMFKGIFFYEYDTKQRYIKDAIDSIAYDVKITGVLTGDEYADLKTKLNSFAKFDDTGIILEKGVYVDGNLSNLTAYNMNTQLNKGDAFVIYIKSSNVSNYSRMQNGGVSADDSQNLYYKAKAQCRVEFIQ